MYNSNTTCIVHSRTAILHALYILELKQLAPGYKAAIELPIQNPIDVLPTVSAPAVLQLHPDLP